MLELGYESISGTPGTSASLTLAAITSPIAFPRMSAIGTLSTPIHYTIEDSTGQVLCQGVGICTAAGAFTRVKEFSHYGGTYVADPSGLYSLPSGCKIYCGASGANVAPMQLPHLTQMWFEPGGRDTGSATLTVNANRDHFWRFRNTYPWPIDAIAVHTGSIATLDVGIYSVDPADGEPAILLLGWHNITSAAGMNELTLASRTLGAMAASPQSLPTGDLIAMMNVSTGNIGRVVAAGGAYSGSLVSDLNAPQVIQYATRTAGTTFGDNPTITGRLTTAFLNPPLLAARAE